MDATPPLVEAPLMPSEMPAEIVPPGAEHLNVETTQDLITKFSHDVINLISTYIPNILGAVAILIFGWIAALIVSGLIGGLVNRTRFDQMLANSLGSQESGKISPISDRIKSLTFYLIMLFVLVGFFQALGLTLITEPLNEMLNQIFAFAPRLLGCASLFTVAWLVATVLRKVTSSALNVANLDKALSRQTGSEELPVSISKTISDTVYWLVFLIVLPTILNSLGLVNVLDPLNNMFNDVLGYLPNIISAGVIGFIGWFIARIVQRITTNVLMACGADKFITDLGISNAIGTTKPSTVIGTVAYVMVLFPIVITALDALSLDAIVKPATTMLTSIMSSIPYVFAALMVVVIATVVGRLVSTLAVNVLESVGFDNLLVWLGVSKAVTSENANSATKPSKIVGHLVLGAIVLFASMESFNLLGFESIGRLLLEFIQFSGHILVGLIIFAVGLILSNYTYKAVESTGTNQSHLLAIAGRLAVLILAAAMGLGQMGLAPHIIELAFGTLFGAIAIGIAIAIGVAFGWGGKKVVEQNMESWVANLKK